MTAQAAQPRCHNTPQTNCTDCRLAGICLPISLEISDVTKLNNIIQRGRPIQKKEHVYHAGDAFRSVYAVHTGAIKTIKITEDGIEQVTGFHLPGEIIGIDGLATNQYSNSAIALETSSICEIPFNQLEDLSMQIPHLQRRFFQIMSKEIAEEQQLITMLSKNNAEERIAALLLSISTRNHNRGLSSKEFNLPMSRSDIGNFLGLTIETVSRIFTRLHKSGIIELDKKHVKICNIDALTAASFGSN